VKQKLTEIRLSNLQDPRMIFRFFLVILFFLSLIYSLENIVNPDLANLKVAIREVFEEEEFIDNLRRRLFQDHFESSVKIDLIDSKDSEFSNEEYDQS
jgi:hypothetical protein